MVTINNSVGKAIKQRRLIAGLSLSRLSAKSGVSISHLGRIEGGERLPSASVLRRLAEPLGISEIELFSYAGFLSPESVGMLEGGGKPDIGKLDPYVATLLAAEPISMQRTLIGLFAILKEIAKGGE